MKLQFQSYSSKNAIKKGNREKRKTGTEVSKLQVSVYRKKD